MPRPNDLSRSLVALDQNSTIIAVVELSQSSWLVGGVVPFPAPTTTSNSSTTQSAVTSVRSTPGSSPTS